MAKSKDTNNNDDEKSDTIIAGIFALAHNYQQLWGAFFFEGGHKSNYYPEVHTRRITLPIFRIIAQI